MLYVVIGLFLFVIPLICNMGWGDGIRFPKENFSIIGMLAVIGMSFFFYRLKPFRNKWLYLFWAWCFLTTIFAYYLLPLYFKDIVLQMPSPFFAYKELFYISLSIMTLVCLASVVPKERKSIDIGFFEINFCEVFNLQNIAKAVVWCVIFMSLYGIFQALGMDELFRVCDYDTGWVGGAPLGKAFYAGNMARRVVGTLGNPSILAVWLSICAPLCLYLRRKVGYVAFFLILVVIALTKSFTASVGLLVGVFVYLLFNHRKILGILLFISIPLVWNLSGSDFVHNKLKNFVDPTGRVEVHKEVWKLIIEKPTFGFGLGSFEYLVGNNPKIITKLNNQMWKELHDEPGQIWFTTGIIGLILYLLFVFSIVKGFLKNITEESSALFASVASFFVMSFGYFVFRVAPISFYGLMFTGLLLQKIGEGE